MNRSIRRPRPTSLAAASAALVLAALTTACSDAPTGPASAAPSAARQHADTGAVLTAASGTLFQNYGSVRIVNPSGVLMKGTIEFVRIDKVAPSVVVSDNSAADLNPAVGLVRAALPWSGGTVRAIAKMNAPFSSRFYSERPLVIGETDFGTVAPKYMPHVKATMTRTDNNAVITGGGVRVERVFDGALLAQVTDNGPGDHDSSLGHMKVYFDSDAKVRITENPIPAGFMAPQNLTQLTTQAFGFTSSNAFLVVWQHTPFAPSR
jgi:hypothetical protein